MAAHPSNPNGPHLSEENFLKYLPYLEQLSACFPEPLTIHPENRKSSTFAVQFRNAGNAFLIHEYPCGLDHDRFKQIWKEKVIRVVGEAVVIAPPKTPVDTITVAEKPATYLFTLTSPTTDQMEAAFRVIESGISTLPIQIIGPYPTMDIPNTVILQPRPDGTHLLL